MMILILLLFSSIIDAASQVLTGFVITPELYVDSNQWLEQAAKRPNEFPSYIVDLSGIDPLAQLLTKGMMNKRLWPTKLELEPGYISRLKECAVFKEVEPANNAASNNNPPRYTLFVCFLAGIQLQKLITRLQLETAYRFAENNQVSEFFVELKTDDFDRLSSTDFYSNTLKDAKRFFGPTSSQDILIKIKECDSSLQNTPSSMECETTLTKTFRDFLLALNQILLGHKAKL